MKRTTMAGLAGLLALGLFIGFPAGAQGIDPHQEVTAFLQAYAQAVAAHDLAALKDLYSEDMEPVSLSDSGEPLTMGAARILRPWQEEFQKGYPFTVGYEWIKAGGSGRVLWFAAAMNLRDRRRPDAAPLRLLWSGILYREWGKWRLVQEHTSTRQAAQAR